MFATLALVPALMAGIGGSGSQQGQVPPLGPGAGQVAKGVLPPTLVVLRSVILDPDHPKPKPASDASEAGSGDPLGLGSLFPSIPLPSSSSGGMGDVGAMVVWGLKLKADRDLLETLWGRSSARYFIPKLSDATAKKAALASGLGTVPTGSYGYPYAHYPVPIALAYGKALKVDYVGYVTWVALRPPFDEPAAATEVHGNVQLSLYDVATGKALSPVVAKVEFTPEKPDATYEQAKKVGTTFGSYLGGLLYDRLQQSTFLPPPPGRPSGDRPSAGRPPTGRPN